MQCAALNPPFLYALNFFNSASTPASPLMRKITMSSSSSSLLLFFLFFILSCTIRLSSALDFDVGDDAGWEVPPSNNTNFYNHWASKNRFRIGDTIRFRYRRDSVMAVSEEDYESCLSSHPLFFSNTGTTEFELDGGAGQMVYYFISGTAGHCELGQRMVVKVLSGGAEGPSGSSRGAVGKGDSAGTRRAESSGAALDTAAVGSLEVILTMAVVLLFQYYIVFN